MNVESAAPRGTNSKEKDQFAVEFHGRKFRVFREFEGGNWLMRIEKDGKQFKKSMGTPIREIAKKNATEFLKSLFSESWEQKIEGLRLKARPQSTVGELVDCYELYAGSELKIARETVSGNAAYLIKVLTTVYPDVAQIRDLRIEKIDEECFREYIRISRQLGRSDASIRSTLAQARSVLSSKLRHLYASKLRLPEKLLGQKLETKLVSESEPFVPFPAEMVAKMEAAVLELESANTRRCYFLMARLGLRNKEALNARWTWFEVHDGQTVIVLKNRPDEGFKLKNSLPGVIPVDKTTWAQLNQDRRADAAHVIDVIAPTMRQKVTDRAINAFVRQFIPDRQKGAYELRKWAGSIVASRAKKKFGDSAAAIYAAQIFLRHRSIKTTEAYYATYLKTVSGVSEDDIAQLYNPPAVFADPAAQWLSARGWISIDGQWSHINFSPAPCSVQVAFSIQMSHENSVTASASVSAPLAASAH